MRFIHISDLHLGKQLGNLSLLEDQADALFQVSRAAREEQADAVVIAGDIYQTASPSPEAMELFSDFLTGLAQAGITVLAISGNHDSAPRVSYLSPLLTGAGIYMSERFDGKLQHVTLRDAHGEVVFWLLPWLRPSGVRPFYPDESIRSCQDAVEAVFRHAGLDESIRNVLLCHQFFTGSEAAGSEELMVGGLDQVSAAVLSPFDYVALGHIHRPQRVGSDTVRYSGSPLRYSFAEAGQNKSMTVVELGEKGDTRVRTVPILPKREVRLVDGLIDELRALPCTEDLVWVTVRDELVPPDTRVLLSANFPNMIRFSIRNSRTAEDTDIKQLETLENKDDLMLFTEFFRSQTGGNDPTGRQLELMKRLLSPAGGDA